MKKLLIKLIIKIIFSLQLKGEQYINCMHFEYEYPDGKIECRLLNNHSIINGYEKEEGAMLPEELLHMPIIKSIFKTHKAIKKLKNKTPIFVRSFPRYDHEYKLIHCRILTM
jgi:hypothetical protein